MAQPTKTNYDPMDRSLSESNIHDLESTPPKFVCERKKRKNDGDIKISKEMDDLSSFKEEMRSMITSLFATQQQELKKIDPALTKLRESNTKIESSVVFLNEQFEDLRKEIKRLETQSKKDKEYIVILENKVEDMHKSSRKANIEIKNVPKNPNETKEDLIEMVLSLATSVSAKFTKDNIRDIYRVRAKKENVQNSPIVVETSSTIIKTDILRMCKTFNIRNKSKLCTKHLGFRSNENTPIYVSEQITPKGARLHFLARDLVKSRLYKYCWTAYGNVYVRKDDHSPVLTVTNEEIIHKLMQNG